MYNNSIPSELLVFMYLRTHIYIHICVLTISDKEAMDLRDSNENYMEGFGGMKGKEEMM